MSKLPDILRDYLLAQGHTDIFIEHAPDGENILVRGVWQRPYTKDGLENYIHEIVEIQAERGNVADLLALKNSIIDDLIGLSVLDQVTKCTLNREETVKKNGGKSRIWLGWFEFWGQIVPEEE